MQQEKGELQEKYIFWKNNILGHKKIVMCAVLVLITFLTYLNSFHNQFVWDDDHFIHQNVFTQSFHYIPQIFTSNTVAGAGASSDYYRPLTTLSFAVDHAIWGWNVVGLHFTNTLLHAVCALLIFALLLTLGLQETTSFWISVIFAVHPVQTEAITYLSSRGDALYSLFFLSSLLLFTWALKGRKVWLIPSFIFFVASIFSKETGLAMIPLYGGVLAIDAVRKNVTLKDVHKKYQPHIMMMLGGVLIMILYVLLRLTYLNFHDFFNFSGYQDLYTSSLLVRLYTFLKVIWIDIKLVFYPYPLYLERSTSIVTNWYSVWVLSGLALIGLIIYLGTIEFRRHHTLFIWFGLLWMACHLIPVSGIIPMTGIFHENWLYMPIVGFLLILFRTGQLFLSPKIKDSTSLRILGSITVIVLACMTINQNTKWKDRITYYEHNLRFTETARLELNLGNAYVGQGQYEKAITHLERAKAIEDAYPQTYYNLGIAYNALGQKDKAEVEWKASLELDPNYIYVFPLLVDLYLSENKPAQALPYIKRLSSIYPEDAQLKALLGTTQKTLEQKHP